MKKLLTSFAVFAVALMAVVMAGSTEVQATTFENIKVYEVNEMMDFDSKIGLSWEKTWSLNKDAGVESQTIYGKFTLSRDSIVRIKTVLKDQEAFAVDDTYYLYSNSAMASPVLENNVTYVDYGDDLIMLKAGTYYMEYKSELYFQPESSHTTKIMIGAIPAENPITVSQAISTDRTKMTIQVTPKYATAEEVSVVRWEKGKGVEVNTASEEADKDRRFVVTENGWYSVRVNVPDTAAGQGLEYFLNIQVKGIGAGAKKGVTYTVNNVQYKLVKAGFDGKGTVMVTGVKKAKATVTIPNKVNIGNHDYQVVKINNKAFYKKNKIKNIVIKATGITTIGKNAFKGINPKATITVPKAKYAKYKKLLTKKTGFVSKTMKLKKK